MFSLYVRDLFVIVYFIRDIHFQRYCEYAETVSKFAGETKTNEKATAFVAGGIRIYEIREVAQFCARATNVDST